MSALPIRRQHFRTAEFAAWLVAQGAEVAAPTNPYEVIRYRAHTLGGSKAATNIVYSKDNGLLTFGQSSRQHYEAFLEGRPCPGMFVSKLEMAAPSIATARPAGKSERRRQRLLDRDGDGCWFCGLPLGADVTIEHLVARSKGGADHLENFALAHQACNLAAADKPLVEKIALRGRMRADANRPILADANPGDNGFDGGAL